MFRPLKPHQYAVDVVVTLAFFGITVQIAQDLAQLILAFGMSSALLLGRMSPPLALGIAWLVAIGQMAAGMAPGFANLAILAVLFSTAAHGDRIVKWLGLISVGVGALVGAIYLSFSGIAFFFGLRFDFTSFANLAAVVLQFAFLLIAMLVLLGLPWTAGLLVRTRIVASESRAAQLAAQYEVERAEQEVIVEQERNRIARDMHDVVAHSLAVVIAQADGARYLGKNDPGAVDDALQAISTTARAALADVRLLLGQLRHNQPEGSQPTLADLDRLFEQFRTSGLLVTVETTGEPMPLGSGQQLAVFRIVQEALTNALRHGDNAEPAVVRFEWTADTVEMTVVSRLLSSPVTGELRLGHGLAGMRERAALAGGSLSTGVSGEHFSVSASIPVSEKVVRS